jgi:hypothetical protein
VSFAAITFRVASQRGFTDAAAVYFVVDSVRKLLDTHSYVVSLVINGIQEQNIQRIRKLKLPQRLTKHHAIRASCAQKRRH